MIKIRMASDYSPMAPEQQETDNLAMVKAGLHCAGLDCTELATYLFHSENAASAYSKALGDPQQELPSGRKVHAPWQWTEAQQAAKPELEYAANILVRAGITLKNELKEAVDDGHYSEILTTVCNGFNSQTPVVEIYRAITDEEAESYTDNTLGWASFGSEGKKVLSDG